MGVRCENRNIQTHKQSVICYVALRKWEYCESAEGWNWAFGFGDFERQKHRQTEQNILLWTVNYEFGEFRRLGENGSSVYEREWVGVHKLWQII